MRRRSIAVLAASIAVGGTAIFVAATPRLPGSPTAAAVPGSGTVASLGTVASPGTVASSGTIGGSAAPSATPWPSPPESPARSTPGAAPSHGPNSGTAIPQGSLQGAIARFRSTGHIPGISVTIRWPDGRTWTGVSGYADVAGKVKVTPNTAFAIASMSKTFTSALILELVAQGRLGLNDRVDRWLPDLAPQIRGVSAGVTVRMLLDHTSGLSDYFENPLIDRLLQGKPDLVWTPEMALKYVRAPYFKPGTAWHYSNTNYLLLGLIAERVTGVSLDEELRERFFDPLHLDHTWYQVAESPKTAIAHGYRLLNSGPATKALDLTRSSDVMPFRSVVTAAGGAGSVAATSGDLAIWAEALYGGKVLPESAFRMMVDDVPRTAHYKPRLPYGLGVQAPKIESWPTLGHSGRLLGFRGAVRYVTTAGVTIAVLTNQSRVDVSPLVRRLLRIILAPTPAPVATPSGVPGASPSATP